MMQLICRDKIGPSSVFISPGVHWDIYTLSKYDRKHHIHQFYSDFCQCLCYFIAILFEIFDLKTATISIHCSCNVDLTRLHIFIGNHHDGNPKNFPPKLTAMDSDLVHKDIGLFHSFCHMWIFKRQQTISIVPITMPKPLHFQHRLPYLFVVSRTHS